MTNTAENRRILLVDDLESIHSDFSKILASSAAVPTLQDEEALLFGTSTLPPPVAVSFEMDSAFQGREALERVKASLTDGRPYAMAFVDMRMPPGWDGVETVEQLWAVDPLLQVVFCTAYADYSWRDVLARLDVRDRLLILKKPFDAIEVYQFANTLTAKWRMAQQAAFKMNELEQAVEERTRDLSDANIIVQNSPVILYRLRGEPSFPLIYVSQNITKYGYDPQTLVSRPDWAELLIHADDRANVGEAMARLLGASADGASIEFRLRAGDGNLRWVENRYVPVRDAEGRLIEVEGIVIDITERKVAEEKIAQLARTDGLTGLANRSTFVERLHQAFAAAQRGAMPFAVMYLDLDKFKPINDTFGHPAGDLLLKEVAHRVRQCTRETDLVARLGGDEFAILQSDVNDPAKAGELAARIQTELSRKFDLNGREANISVSIGICAFIAGIADADSMLVQADLALYRSKDQGRNQYHFHSEALDLSVAERMSLGVELLRAIDGNQLELLYQPQVEISTRKIIGMEALVRWNHPTRGLLSPAAFLPVAEKTGIVVQLGQWVLDQACRQMKLWREQGHTLPVIAVNLSLHQLRVGDAFIRDVERTLEKWALPASQLEFDVTEATLAQLKWSGNDVLPKLRALGVKLAIDRFGSEYSSLNYIREYGVNHLKIAPFFVQQSGLDSDHAASMKAIIAFARDMGIPVIAQSVESEEQCVLLQETDPSSHAQGFHFSKPVNAQKAGELLCGRALDIYASSTEAAKV